VTNLACLHEIQDSRSKEQQLSSLVTELQAQLLAANRLVTLNGVRRDVESTAKAQLAGHAEGVDQTALCNLLSDCENTLTDALAAVSLQAPMNRDNFLFIFAITCFYAVMYWFH
jgi:hypothetical protein